MHAGMQLHHQPVLQAHARHLGQHLAAEHLGIHRPGPSGDDPVEQRLGLGRRQVGGGGGRMPVVGGGGAGGHEVPAADGECREVSPPGQRVLAGQPAKLLEVAAEARGIGIDHGIRAEGGHHPAGPAGLPDRAVMVERVEGALGGCQRLDAEALEQRPGPELGAGQAVGDAVVDGVGIRRGQPLGDAEHLGQRMLPPQPARGGAESVPVRGDGAPDPARVGLHGPAVEPRHAEILQPDTLAVQHAQHVVVRDHQQLGRVRERRVIGEPCRIGVAVRADDRQAGDLGIQPPRDRAIPGIRREQAILMHARPLATSGRWGQTAPVPATASR